MTNEITIEFSPPMDVSPATVTASTLTAKPAAIRLGSTGQTMSIPNGGVLTPFEFDEQAWKIGTDIEWSIDEPSQIVLRRPGLWEVDFMGYFDSGDASGDYRCAYARLNDGYDLMDFVAPNKAEMITCIHVFGKLKTENIGDVVVFCPQQDSTVGAVPFVLMNATVVKVYSL